MTRMTRQSVSALALAMAVSSAPGLLAAQEADPGANASRTMVTEFRGRPPFKRQFFSSEEIAEMARFEETESSATGEEVRVVDFRGRPPFKREILSSDEVAELARFEETSTSSEPRRTRRGPPGKMNSRR